MDDPWDTPLEPPETLEPSLEPGEDGYGSDPADSLSPEEDAWSDPFRAADEPGYVQVEFTSDHVSAESIQIAGQVFNQQFSFAAGGVESVRLSTRHFASRTPEELEICEEELVFEDREIEELRASLEETRILVLAGEPEGGKGSLGLLLGARLIRELRWRGLLTCRGLGSGVQIDLEKVAEDEAFSRHVVMFEDALAGESSDLKTFLKNLDPLCLATLQDRLRRNSAALLMTAASPSLADCERRLENLGVLRMVAPPSPGLLVQALRRFASGLPRRGSGKEPVESFLNDHQADLLRELKTIPRVSRFVQEYLVEVVEGNLSLRQALGRMNDLSQWLTADLASDLDAQASVLAIVLGSAVPPAAGVPYPAFDSLRRGITELLRKELRIPEDQPSSPAGLGRDFLDRARAYVAAMPSPSTGLVRFRDERYAHRLWQALVGPARDLAMPLIPLLRELALGEDPHLRPIAASALGRLGQLGPADLAVPLLEIWTRQGAYREELPGFFLQGSAGSGDEAYADLCLGALRGLAFGGGAGVPEAAVRNLSLLGLPDPEVPIRELCGIARERLPFQIDELRQIAREVAAKEVEIRRAVPPGQVSPALRKLRETEHDLLIALVPGDRIRLLGAVQYALGGVLFSQGDDPGPVLRKLSARMKPEPAGLAPLFAYLFLHRKGLIDLLDRYKWSSGNFGRKTSRFLLSSRTGARDPEALHDLLERIFSTLGAFPGSFRVLLERRFLEILNAWSREGCEEISLRPTAVRLLSALLTSRNAELRRMMERYLETEPELLVPGSRLRALARDVLDGKVRDDAPAASSRPRRLPAWMGKRGGEGE